MAKRKSPQFRGVKVYSDPEGDFDFNYSKDWNLFPLSEEYNGVMVSPQPENPQTWISVWKVKNPEAIHASDAQDLKDALRESLFELPGCEIESEAEEVIDDMIKLEWILTFREQDATRKRKLWALFSDTRQISICFQGATPEEYDYWLAMANYTFFTIKLPDHLWYAPERDLVGLRKDRPNLTIQSAAPGGEPDWLEPVSPFRISLLALAGEHDRFDRPAEIVMDLTEFAAENKQTLMPIRLVEVNDQGQVIDPQVLFQYDPQPGDTGRGRLIFMLKGHTPAGGDRRFHAYLGFEEQALHPIQGAPLVAVDENIEHEAQESYCIHTPAGTYYYHKQGAGFASLEDPDGNDWIGYQPGGRSAGEFRGIPNLVEPEGFFHPGSQGSESQLFSRGPLKAVIASKSDNGQWACFWEIYPHYANLTVLKVGHPYWFLYEGTPGGKLDTENGFMVRSPGIRTPLSEPWNEVIPGPKWVYFGSTQHQRAIYLIQKEDDQKMDSYWPMNGEMTVFGFGRNRMNIYLERTPAHFTIGLTEGADDETIRKQIGNAMYDLDVRVGNLEMRR